MMCWWRFCGFGLKVNFTTFVLIGCNMEQGPVARLAARSRVGVGDFPLPYLGSMLGIIRGVDNIGTQ